MTDKKHILLQGFGSFPLNFKALIEHARAAGDDSIEWSIICTTGHYVKIFQDLLGPDAVLYLQNDMKNYLDLPDLLDRLSNYEGNIYRNIESEKRLIKGKKAHLQVRGAAAMYLSVKEFMQKRKPTHVLFGQIEGMDGMTMLSVSKELGIPVLMPIHTRHLAETFFSPDHLATLPPGRPVSKAAQAKAESFLQRFRSGQTGAVMIPSELINVPDETWPFPRIGLLRRIYGVFRRMADEPDMREWEVLRAAIFFNLPLSANLYRDVKAWINRRIYDIKSIDKLPKRFAYYPMQYTPEASINTPAPYFIDQMRAIDAIRFALPSDMMLVVKEHPACIGVRWPGFLLSFQKKAGILLARYNMPSEEIIEKADIVFSVTGTATLEAFLKGKPSLTLGNSFFTEFFGGATGVDALPQRVKQALAHPPTDQVIVKAIARIFSISGPFVMGSPLETSSPFSKYSLNRTNIKFFYLHLRRELDFTPAQPTISEMT
ncbi:MAG: hypothetical protein JWO78_1880 [Micavibrio sp.]|nr:hypothetical protein [Micavibrio sp.]